MDYELHNNMKNSLPGFFVYQKFVNCKFLFVKTDKVQESQNSLIIYQLISFLIDEPNFII